MWGRGGPGSQGRAVLGAAISAARRLELRWEQVSERLEPAVYTESPPELLITRLGATRANVRQLRPAARIGSVTFKVRKE